MKNEIYQLFKSSEMSIKRSEAILLDEALDYMIDWYLHDDEVLDALSELKEKINKFVVDAPAFDFMNGGVDHE